MSDLESFVQSYGYGALFLETLLEGETILILAGLMAHMGLMKLPLVILVAAEWDGFRVHYRYRETVYHIAVLRRSAGDGAAEVTVDGVPQEEAMLPLVNDHQEHEVEVRIPAAGS